MRPIPRPTTNLNGADRRALERRQTDRLEASLRNAKRYGHDELASQIESVLSARAAREGTGLTKVEIMRAGKKKPELAPYVETPEQAKQRRAFYEVNKHRLTPEVIKMYRLDK